MTDTAGPFDGTPWAEAQWARHAGVWAPSAVYGTPAASSTAGDLPLSLSALTAGVGAGRAWVRGFGFERSGAAAMQAVTANTHASFSRRDRIVLRRNLATHTVTPVLLTGTPAGTPTAPALTQSESGSWDLPLFSFLVPPNSGTSITGIIDERAWLDPATGLLSFATVAGRDAYFVAPADGSSCWTTDGGFWDRISGAWLARRDRGSITPPSGWSGNIEWARSGKIVTVSVRLVRTAAGTLTISAWDYYSLASGLPARATAGFDQVLALAADNRTEFPGCQFASTGAGTLYLQARWSDRTYVQNNWVHGSFSYVAA